MLFASGFVCVWFAHLSSTSFSNRQIATIKALTTLSIGIKYWILIRSEKASLNKDTQQVMCFECVMVIFKSLIADTKRSSKTSNSSRVCLCFIHLESHIRWCRKNVWWLIVITSVSCDYVSLQWGSANVKNTVFMLHKDLQLIGFVLSWWIKYVAMCVSESLISSIWNLSICISTHTEKDHKSSLRKYWNFPIDRRTDDCINAKERSMATWAPSKFATYYAITLCCAFISPRN